MKWKLEKGSTLRYECTRTLERRNRKEAVRFGLNFVITDVQDGRATIQVTIDEAGEEMPAAVGKSFEMKLEETGEIAELQGVKDVPGFGDEEMKNLLDAAFPRLPRESVAEDGFWKSESTLSLHMLGDVPAKSLSKVTGRQGHSVEFETKTKLDVAKAKSHMEIWDAVADGRGKWDADSGRLSEYSTDVKVTLEAHGQILEMTVKTTLRWAPSKGSQKESKSEGHGNSDRHHDK